MGGVTDGKGNVKDSGFKAVQICGTSDDCLTEEHLDFSLDFDSFKKVGAMIGSGGLIIMNKSTCMVRHCKVFYAVYAE